MCIFQGVLPKKNGLHTEIFFNAGCETYVANIIENIIANMVHKAGKLLKYQRKPYRYEFEDSRDEFIVQDRPLKNPETRIATYQTTGFY